MEELEFNIVEIVELNESVEVVGKEDKNSVGNEVVSDMIKYSK